MVLAGLEWQNFQISDQDFTVDAYRQLVSLVLTTYQVTDYRSIPWGQRFALWRHDCDVSLNRSLVLAKIEAEMGLKSTFFVNPHCEFYNLLERSQLALVKQIVQLGHDIGLHFDAAFYNTTSEAELHEQVSHEADLLEQFIGLRPATFSFHDPSAFHLTCEADIYGGLVNCYSKRFKTEVPYYSDSNGYWRFGSLFDVLSDAKDSCLQILTHPGWWQDESMPPRQRIFQSVYGRYQSILNKYDEALQAHGRVNFMGNAQPLTFLNPINKKLYEHCDYLWNTKQHQTLYIELWRLHESQINRLCKATIRKEWAVSARDINTFFEDESLLVDGWQLFKEVFGNSWQSASGQSERTHQTWLKVRNQLIHGRGLVEPAHFEAGCAYLCNIIESLAIWGLTQITAYDGLARLDSIGQPTDKSIDDSLNERLEGITGEISEVTIKRWKVFKENMIMDSASNFTKKLDSD